MKRPFRKGLLILVLSCTLMSCNERVLLDETVPSEDTRDISIKTNFASQTPRLRSEISERAQYIAKDVRRISFNGIRTVFYSIDESETPQKVLYTFDKEINCDKGMIKSGENASIDRICR